MTDVRERLDRILAERIAILDGAMGTAIQAHRLSEDDVRSERFRDHPRDLRGAIDILNLTQPEIVAAVHRGYLAAGADIVSTNTFTATPVSQDDYGLAEHTYEINRSGAEIARRVVDEVAAETGTDRFVAGSVGPTNQTLSISPHVSDPSFRGATFDGIAEGYAVAIRGLVDGGVDVLLIETIFDTLNAKAALVAAREAAPQLPLWISVTIEIGRASCRERV